MDESQIYEIIDNYIKYVMNREGLEINDYTKGCCNYFTAEDIEKGMKILAKEMLNVK